LIQHPGDAELEFIPDAAAFDTWQVTSTPATLIDKEGKTYVIGRDKHLIMKGLTSLEEILALIRAHAILEGICCTPKLGAPDIPTALTILSSIVKG